MTQRKSMYRPRQAPDTEYRVDYRRPGKRPQARIFQAQGHLERFIAEKLLGDGRPELDPIIQVEIRSRKVGPWRPHRSRLVDTWLQSWRRGDFGKGA